MKISTLDQSSIGLTDKDIVQAMKNIPGYLDITPDDFMELYQMAYRHALERLKSAVKAEHVMTKKVIAIDENESIIETARLMAEHNISGLPVVNGQNKVSGVVSEKDFLKSMNASNLPSFMHVVMQCLDNSRRCAAHELKKLSVKDIMSSPPIFVETVTPVLEVAKIFEINNINRVPVLNKDSNMAGIIARSDLVKALC